MTNAEKYLKDNVSVEEFAEKLTKKISRWDELSYYSEGIEKDIIEYLNEEAKPTLTEDERVILRNIDKKFTVIGKDESVLYFGKEKGSVDNFIFVYNHLFQFIKERRRI